MGKVASDKRRGLQGRFGVGGVDAKGMWLQFEDLSFARFLW